MGDSRIGTTISVAKAFLVARKNAMEVSILVAERTVGIGITIMVTSRNPQDKEPIVATHEVLKADVATVTNNYVRSTYSLSRIDIEAFCDAVFATYRRVAIVVSCIIPTSLDLTDG